MVKALAAFLDFCYLVRHPSINQDQLFAIQEALDRFHRYRKVFERTGIREKGFSLPRQHAMVHYVGHIIAFGAPNGLCSSITESMHIRAVKKPWRRSSRNNPLPQMLSTNTRLSKLAAFRRSLINRGMLDDPRNLAPPVHCQQHGTPSDSDSNSNTSCQRPHTTSTATPTTDSNSHRRRRTTTTPPETDVDDELPACQRTPNTTTPPEATRAPPGVLNHVVLARTRGKHPMFLILSSLRMYSAKGATHNRRIDHRCRLQHEGSNSSVPVRAGAPQK